QQLVEAEGRHCHLIQGDCRDAGFCRTLVDETVAVLGGLDILVNNAAEQHVQQELEDIDDEQMRITFETNFFPHFYITKAALRYLQSGATIINTGSVTSFRGSPVLMDYSAT